MNFTREDYEMAAKAAGIGGTYQDGEFGPGIYNGHVLDRCWNPPEDDGDALRLAVKLHLTVCMKEHEIEVFWDDTGEFLCSISTEDQYRLGATRHAIFRAAIAIGKAMPAPELRPNSDAGDQSPSVGAADQQIETQIGEPGQELKKLDDGRVAWVTRS